MRNKFNRNAITIKVDSVHNLLDGAGGLKYNPFGTERKAEALTCIFESANPLRAKYVFTHDDYDYIAEAREEVAKIIGDLERYLDALPTKIGV